MITIILLLIIVGIVIIQLMGSELFKNAQLAKEKSENMQVKENKILTDYENKIGEYISGYREQITVDKEEYEKLKKRVDVLEQKCNEQREIFHAYSNKRTQVTTTSEFQQTIMPLEITNVSSNKLILENNSIKIGKGVNLIKVDYGLVIEQPSESVGYMLCSIFKNNVQQPGTISNSSIMYLNTISRSALISVTEGDVIHLITETRRAGSFFYAHPSIVVEIVG